MIVQAAFRQEWRVCNVCECEVLCVERVEFSASLHLHVYVCVWVQRAKEGSVSFGFVRPPPSCFSVLLWAEGEACAWERQQLFQMSSGTQTLGG